MKAVHRRLALLVALITVALGAAACGRATEDQINQALGITPTATQSAEQVAAATEAVSATAAARLLAASSPGAAGAAVLGDVTQGSRQFQTQCSGCHRPGGAGPDILSPGSPGETVTAEMLLPLVREAVGHADPPGPYPKTLVSDKQVAD